MTTNSILMGPPWIPAAKIDALVQLEPGLATLGLIFAGVVIYKFFLGDVSEERHRNLRRHFKNLGAHLFFAVCSFGLYYSIKHGPTADENASLERIGSYIGLTCLLWWMIVFVKICRILLFEYLFLSHMRVGVPLLLVNLLSLLLTVLLGGWLATTIFDIRLAPLLATSAIFSVVLGLALQDTLGNLFSGVAMQFDKPYEIGDWIEIILNGQKYVGQIHEISWRATVMIGITEESISIPNRLMGQTLISNYSAKARPFCRSQMFRVAYGASTQRALEVLTEAGKSITSILQEPAPSAFVFESNDSYVTVKLVYYFKDFGRQYLIGGDVLAAGNDALDKAGIAIAPSRLVVFQGQGQGQGGKTTPAG